MIVAVGDDVRSDIDAFCEKSCIGPESDSEVGVDAHALFFADEVVSGKLVGENVGLDEVEKSVEETSGRGTSGSEDGGLRHGGKGFGNRFGKGINSESVRRKTKSQILRGVRF